MSNWCSLKLSRNLCPSVFMRLTYPGMKLEFKMLDNPYVNYAPLTKTDSKSLSTLINTFYIMNYIYCVFEFSTAWLANTCVQLRDRQRKFARKCVVYFKMLNMDFTICGKPNNLTTKHSTNTTVYKYRGNAWLYFRIMFVRRKVTCKHVATFEWF